MNEDDIRDLTPEDALELKAFLDKRRWFEGKLKLLEEVPPIYPFVHPDLTEPSVTDDIPTLQYASHVAENSWTLPTRENIKSWQAERASLEEEILAFDGGDLSRMKQKTRAATLLPLTPSSTHLVSITLELIVIVDRLMKLLRHRAELLELTSIRLEWDKLRWQIMLETAKVRAEIDTIAKDRGRWVAPASEPVRIADAHTGEVRTPVQRSSGLPSLSSVSSALSDIPDSSYTPAKSTTVSRTKRDSVSSISSFVNSPKRTLYLPLLHSSIVTLGIRQKNLTSTTLARSGKLLDRMIDLAIPLRDLGGVDGPGSASEAGAVPDDLLDIQDDLENDAKELKKRVSWCQELEEQWKHADDHHLASTKALEAALILLERLGSAIAAPADLNTQTDLSTSLDEARALLPSDIGATFPRPSHPAFTEYDDYTLQLISVLHKRREEAQMAITRCHQGIEWYSRMAGSSTKIVEAQTELESLIGQLAVEISVLENGERQKRPPVWENVNLENLRHGWVNVAALGVPRAHSLLSQANETNQRITLELLQSRKHIRSMPQFLQDSDSNGCSTETLDQASVVSDEATDLIDKARSVISVAEFDIATIPSVRSILSTDESLRTGIDDIRSAIRWDDDGAMTSTVVESLRDRLRTLTNTHERDIVTQIAKVSDLLKQQGRVQPALITRLGKTSSAVNSDLSDLERTLSVIRAIANQRQIVEDIETEADRLVSRMRGTQNSVEELRVADHPEKMLLLVPPELATATAVLGQETSQWLAGLAERVPFISTTGASLNSACIGEGSPSDTRPSQPLLSPNSSLSAPPITPPATPPPSARSPEFTGALCSHPLAQHEAAAQRADGDSRKRVNESAARVKSQFASLRDAVDTFVSGAWRKRLFDIDSEMNASTERYGSPLATFEDRLQLIDVVLDEELDADDLASIDKDMDDVAKAWLSEDIDGKLVAIVADHEQIANGLDQLDERDKDELKPELSVLQANGRRIVALQERATKLTNMLETVSNRLAQSREETITAAGSLAERPAEANSTDVFGVVSEVLPKPTPTLGGTDITVDSLIDRMSSLDLDSILFATSTSHKSNLQRPIPTSPVARRIKNELRAILEGLRFLQGCQPTSTDEGERLAELDQSLSVAFEHVPHLDKLMAVSQAVKACDETFSRLLDDIDSYHPNQEDELRSLQQLAVSALSDLRQTAAVIPDDSRVTAELKRTETSWAELEGLVEETLHPDTASVRSDTVSEVSSINSRSTTFYRHPLSRPAARNASNPTMLPTRATPEPRNRAASDTPTRMRIDSMKSGLPRLRKISMGPLVASATPTAPSPRTRVSSIPRPTRSSLSNSKTGSTLTTKAAYHTAPRARMSSRPSLSALPNSLNGPRKTYVADPKSKLDMAVGNIVNKLKVDVPIRPVGVDKGDEWKDQSGKYWIGAEGRAKLCFCRILRSRTVMVRVGGGWVELSKFLMDHFADSLVGWDPMSSGRAGIGIGSSTPVPITSASLSTPLRPRTQGASTPSMSSTRHIDDTDMHLGSSRGGTTFPVNLLTPQKRISDIQHLTPGPSNLSPVGSATPTSPLVPLHFMRRASESPPVRQREKERLGVGRRSILGKSPSGNVAADASPDKDTS